MKRTLLILALCLPLPGCEALMGFGMFVSYVNGDLTGDNRQEDHGEVVRPPERHQR